jgi:hypothetical protein
MTHTLLGHFNATNIIYLFSLFVHKPHYLFVVANEDIPHYLFVVANGAFAFVTMSRTS